MSEIEGYQTAAEAARRLGVDERQVRNLASEGRISGAVKVGGVWLMPEDSWPSEKNEGGPGRPPKWAENGKTGEGEEG